MRPGLVVAEQISASTTNVQAITGADFSRAGPEQDVYSLVFNYKPFQQMEFNFQKHVSLLPGGYLLMVQGSATPKATDHIHK